MEFPHPSRPDFYGIHFDEELKLSLALCVDILIPGYEEYPSASQARVVEFLESRSSSVDEEHFQQVCSYLSDSGMTVEGMKSLEASKPDLFEWLKNFVYYGYYSSNLVLNALALRGYAYHGAPQPLGYSTSPDQPIPSATRSSFFATEEILKRYA